MEIYVLLWLEQSILTTPTGAVGVRGSTREGGIGDRSAESRSDNGGGGNGRR